MSEVNWLIVSLAYMYTFTHRFDMPPSIAQGIHYMYFGDFASTRLLSGKHA
jgi:hypothetical protein